MNTIIKQLRVLLGQLDFGGAVTGARKVKPKTLLPDGSVAGGRDSNVNRNRVTGANT